MAVLNPIEYDSRVQRAAIALGRHHEVVVLCTVGDAPMSNFGFEIRRVDVRNHSTPGAIASFGRHLVASLRREHFDAVYVHDFNLAPLIPIIKASFPHPIIYDAHELIVGDRRGEGVNPAWVAAERLAVRLVDLTIVANPERAAVMAAHYSFRRQPLVVENIAVSSKASAADLSRGIALPPAATRIVYQGDVTLSRGLGAVIDACGDLAAETRMLVVGGGAGLEGVQAYAAAGASSGRVDFLGKVPATALPSILSACDLGIVTYPAVGLNNIYCAPNKVFEYASAGIPMVASDHPPLVRLVEGGGIGRVFDRSNPGSIAPAINAAIENADEYRAAIPAFLDAHRWEDCERDLRRAVQEVLA